jgi:hypothetical protein
MESFVLMTMETSLSLLQLKFLSPLQVVVPNLLLAFKR